MINRLFHPTTNILNHTKSLKKAAALVADDLHNEATNQFAGFRDEAGDRLSEIRGRASGSWASLKGLAKQYPFAAVGIGVAGGLLLAAFARRK
jgi:ElaB/YqjD/DUF883 family membrane-anchored ribosome-binding protein